MEEVAQAYVEAGSRVIITNTFGGTRFSLSRYGLADRAREINRIGAEIRAAPPATRQGLRVDRPDRGDADDGRCVSRNAPRGICRTGPRAGRRRADALVIETMSDTAEARLAVEAAKQTGLEVVACMVFDRPRSRPDDDGHDAGRSRPGAHRGRAPTASARTAAKGLKGLLAFAGGSAPPPCPIWIKANAGLPEIVDGQTVYRQTPEGFASHVPDLVEAGASFIGGCCGTSPEFIRAVGRKLSP